MDNASVHMLPEVKAAINAAGAYLLYSAPYSPDLNPIEKMFSVYKAALKRNKDMDWLSRHDFAVASVSPQIAGNFFKKCCVPLCGVCVAGTSKEKDFVLSAGVFVSSLIMSNII
mmetsp:Transcript_14007/g.30730  ORF Transcript_14007/g.30730 Transcript_14007/m.30730 type:complete len:114 (-) Transcript_14007:25-366(-)